MDEYRFVTRFTVTADPGASFATALDVQRWVGGWPEATDARVLEVGRADGLGRRGQARLQAPLRLYRLAIEVEVTAVHAPRWFTVVTRGDLRGDGRWTFEPAGDGATAVVFDWSLRVRHPWLVTVGALARPLLVTAHHRAVRRGVEAFAHALDAEVVACRSELADGTPEVSPG